MSPPLDRREFLKAAMALGAVPLAGCSGGLAGSSSPVTPPDFPLGAPLPFAHGVASGDPLKDRVILWTRITRVGSAAGAIAVEWEMSLTPDFAAVVKRGSQTTKADRDWTVKVDAVGLSPATTYYYRFTALGEQSLVGRTRTAPDTMVSEVRFAVVACSSYWSSHWSGYGHIADRNDLDLVLHCGDYIYDFIDEDEFVRSRNGIRDLAHPDNRDWLNLDEVRRRYALFRSDPNLLRAHQQHPWMIVWDNHDISTGYGNELTSPVNGDGDITTLDDVCRAFYEWTPTRPVKADGSGEFLLVDDGSYPEPPDVTLIYRKLSYGGLADFYGIDTQLYLRDDLVADSSHLTDGAPSLFSRKQYDWLTSNLSASQQAGVVWKIVNNQTWFAPADVPDVVAGAPALPKLAISRWSNYTAERAALCDYLRGSNPANQRVRGTVLVSGDAHGNFASDVIEDTTLLSSYLPGAPVRNTRSGSTALNLAAGYTRATTGNTPLFNSRAASVGVEFAPSSMGRGGADELVSRALIDAAESAGLPAINNEAVNIAGTRAVEQALIDGNKNVQFIEWVDHGYGIVHLTAERAVFEFWWQDKLTADSPDVLGFQMVSFAEDDATALPVARYRDQLDSVTAHGMTVAPTSGSRIAAPAPLEQALEPR